MNRRNIPFVVGALAVLGSSAGPLRAQAVSDSIPRELALALLTGFGPMDGTALHVSRIADGLPAAIVPAEATVLGSLGRLTQSTTILALPHPEDEARRLMQERVRASGFTPFAPAEPRQRGFVSSGVAMRPAGAYCRGDESLLLLVRGRELGRSLVWLSHSKGRVDGGLCRVPPPSPRNFMDDLPVPALFPPDGFRSEGGGSGGGGDAYSLTARLIGDGTSEAVVRHYTTQLVADGWSATERTSTDGAAYQLLRREKDGTLAWSAVLLAVGPAGQGPMDVSLALRRH